MLLLKRKLPQKFELAVNTAGFVLLMGLMAVVMFNDVAKLL